MRSVFSLIAYNGYMSFLDFQYCHGKMRASNPFQDLYLFALDSLSSAFSLLPGFVQQGSLLALLQSTLLSACTPTNVQLQYAKIDCQTCRAHDNTVPLHRSGAAPPGGGGGNKRQQTAKLGLLRSALIGLASRPYERDQVSKYVTNTRILAWLLCANHISDKKLLSRE